MDCGVCNCGVLQGIADGDKPKYGSVVVGEMLNNSAGDGGLGVDVALIRKHSGESLSGSENNGSAGAVAPVRLLDGETELLAIAKEVIVACNWSNVDWMDSAMPDASPAAATPQADPICMPWGLSMLPLEKGVTPLPLLPLEKGVTPLPLLPLEKGVTPLPLLRLGACASSHSRCGDPGVQLTAQGV